MLYTSIKKVYNYYALNFNYTILNNNRRYLHSNN